jgi:hypothetical protein
MLAPKANKILQHMEHITADKQQKPSSAIVKHLRLFIAITLVKIGHDCLRGSRKKHQPAAPNNTPSQPSESSPDYRMIHMVKQPTS